MATKKKAGKKARQEEGRKKKGRQEEGEEKAKQRTKSAQASGRDAEEEAEASVHAPPA